MEFRWKSFFAFSIISGFWFLNLFCYVDATPVSENYYKSNYWFDDNGISEETGTAFNEDGFTWDGFYCGTREKVDKKGLDIDRYSKDGLPGSSWLGYGKDGYNHRGFNKYHQHINGTMYDDDGHDYLGFHKDTKVNKYTGTVYDARGYNVNHYDKSGFLDYRYRGGGGLSAPSLPPLLPSLVVVK